jgi:hypothetical protein
VTLTRGTPCIYDIRSLRVSDLTLILLTWRKFGANNVSKWQMGFNSTFKGLNSVIEVGPQQVKYSSLLNLLRFLSVCSVLTLGLHKSQEVYQPGH